MRNINIKSFLILCIVCMMAITLNAQNLKFGKPSKDEWLLTSCPDDVDAPAVVLCKNLSLTYTLNSGFSAYTNESDIDLEGASLGRTNLITSEGTTMTYSVKMRTKILKDGGRGYANLDILYYFSEENMNMRDEFYTFKVTLFRMVDGKVNKRNLDKSFTDETISKDFKVRHLRIPDAQTGDIIEVQYELFSPRIAYIFDWQFQDEIPVQYSLCELNIPSFLNFNVNTAIRSNIKSKVRQGSIPYEKGSNDLTTARTCYSNVYTMESRNMLSWAKDPVRQTQGANIAQVKCSIKNTTISGIPYPMSQPEGSKWITTNPLTPKLFSLTNINVK